MMSQISLKNASADCFSVSQFWLPDKAPISGKRLAISEEG